MTTAADADRLFRRNAASTLATEALEGARASKMRSSSWHFYHGVEAAALQILHPELAAVREGTSWLDDQHPAFRSGFLEATAALTMSGSGELPLRVRLPEPPPES